MHGKKVNRTFHGAELPDPAGLIEGKGNRLRHVKVWTQEQAERPEVRALVAAAWADVVSRERHKAR